MSRTTTGSGAVVECLDPTCSCNQKPVTAGAIDAVDEDRWFDALCDDIEAYLDKKANRRRRRRRAS